MSRPVSWLPRLHAIRESVGNTVRSHYTRAELEELFALQPRQAGALMELLPTLMVGTARMVARDDLAKFLDRVKESEDLPGLWVQLREENAADSRKKVRVMVRRDWDTLTLAEKPAGLFFTRGRVEIDFDTLEELLERCFALARILDNDAEEFARRYERREEPEADTSVAEAKALFEELQELERNRAPREEAPCVETHL